MKHCHVAKSFWASVFFAIACLAIPGYSLAVDWALRMDGIGPLKIGMDFRSANRALGNVLKRTRQSCVRPKTVIMFLSKAIQIWR